MQRNNVGLRLKLETHSYHFGLQPAALKKPQRSGVDLWYFKAVSSPRD